MLRRRIGVGPLLTIPQPLILLGGILGFPPALDLNQSLRGALAQLQGLCGIRDSLMQLLQLAHLQINLTAHGEQQRALVVAAPGQLVFDPAISCT